MLMNELLKMRFISILVDTSNKITNAEMQIAYDEFIKCIDEIGNLEDYSKSFRKLNATRIELVSLKMSLLSVSYTHLTLPTKA